MEIPSPYPHNRRKLTVGVALGAFVGGAVFELAGISTGAVRNLDVIGLSTLGFEGAFTALDIVLNKIYPESSEEHVK